MAEKQKEPAQKQVLKSKNRTMTICLNDGVIRFQKQLSADHHERQ